MHLESAVAKLSGGLYQQIQSVDDKVELRNDSLLLVVVGQVVDIVEGEGGLSAALSVPDDSPALVRLQMALYGFCREYLGVPHDMLLNGSLAANIGDSVAEEKGDALAAEKGSADPVGGGRWPFIRSILRGVPDREEIVVPQDEVLNSRVEFRECWQL